MSSTYIHTGKSHKTAAVVLRVLTALYFASIAAAVAYVWTLAQNRYETAATFKISRQDGVSMDSGLAQIALPGLSDSGALDSQIAIGYITSSDLLTEIEKEYDLLTHYSEPERDFVFRLDHDAQLEDRLQYYRSRITGHYDKDTGLTTVTVDTFDPKLSHTVATHLLKRAENFINDLNQRIAEQQVAFVRAEVDRTSKRVDEINKELISFQNEHQLITPDEVISASVAAVRELQMERLRGEAELASLLRDSPGSPAIDALESKLRSIRELIDIETAKLSGPERDRLNQILVQFKELELKLEFALRMRTAAETMLERNRVEASTRTRFFSVIQNPYMPEDVAKPKRIYASVTIIFIGLFVFLIARAFVHSILEAS